MSGQRISDERLAQLLDCFDHYSPPHDMAKVLRETINARAEIARLTAERDALRSACAAVRKSIVRFPGSAHDRAMAKIDKAFGSSTDYVDPDETALANLQSRYNALLAERAGVSEALVDKLASKINSFLQRNEHSGDLEPKIGKNLRAALEAALERRRQEDPGPGRFHGPAA